MARIFAKFASTCKVCKKPVAAGDPVEWVRGERGVTCKACVTGQPVELSQDQKDKLEALKRHDCREAGENSWWEHDGRGIPLCRVCKVCRTAKLSRYRPEILRSYSQNDVSEPIECDDY